MKRWTWLVESHTQAEILEAVKDEEWQALRRSLKGLPTEKKLDKLEAYWVVNFGDVRAGIQVDNYINALKRGGQLDMNLEVVR